MIEDKITLHKEFMYSIFNVQPPERIKNTQLTTYYNDFLRAELFRLERTIWEEYGPEISEECVVEYSVPATWWDHLKMTYPKLQRFFKEPKVQHRAARKRVIVQIRRRFPDFTPSPPSMGRPVVVYVTRVEDADLEEVSDKPWDWNGDEGC